MKKNDGNGGGRPKGTPRPGTKKSRPDPQADAIARLAGMAQDASLSLEERTRAAQALLEALQPAPAPQVEQPVTPRPLHVPHASASSLDGVPNLFEGCTEKPLPPKPAPPTREELRAKEVERAHDQMQRAVASGNMAAIAKLTEIFRKMGLYAPETAQSAQVTPAVPPPDEAWIWLHQYRLECAAVEGNQERVQELRAAFVERGLPIPEHRGYTPPSNDEPAPPERVVPLIALDERHAALHARRTYPASGGRVMDWEQWVSTF